MGVNGVVGEIDGGVEAGERKLGCSPRDVEHMVENYVSLTILGRIVKTTEGSPFLVDDGVSTPAKESPKKSSIKEVGSLIIDKANPGRFDDDDENRKGKQSTSVVVLPSILHSVFKEPGM